MQEVFDKLRKLQEVLLCEFEIEAELEDIPQELNSLKRKFQRVERTLKELEIKKENDKEKYEGQISLIKTQREYEAITSEIAQIKEKLELIDEEELNVFQEIEGIQKDLEEQTGLHDELKETIIGMEKEINKQLSGKQKELEKCLKDKNQITAGLDEEVIYKFEKIVKKKDGIGIVSIKQNVCMGCNMILPPQFVNNVRREDDIIFCPNCSRILYYFEEIQGEEELVLE
jgi:predicted  nucleic acid-binding Zn-ribbon protein